MPNRLLLADEDPKTSRVLEVSLRGAGFDVTTVTTGAAAWVAIEQELPQVVIADTNLAALDGFELCTRVRALEGGRDVAFILLGADDSLAYRIKSIEAGADDYLLKPPYVQEVLAKVRAQVQRRDRDTFTSTARAAEALAGKLSDLKVVDLLQVIADSKRSGIIHLRGARDAPATIYFRQGQVVDAEVGRLSGVNAISRLFSWTEGSFEVHWKPIRRPNAIGLPTPELVLEGMKRLEERNRLADGVPDLNAIFEVNYRVLAERLSEIPDEVNAVLRLFDGSRTLAHVVEDCQLPDPEAMAIAIRLRDEGIIHNVSRPTASDAESLVVPPRPAARRPPGADDVTVVRRITSLGTGSGPVQVLPRAASAGPSAETVIAPIPSSSFDEVDGVISAPHHAKTDPGVGNPLGLPELEPSARSSEYAAVETGAVVASGAADASARARIHDQPTGPHDITDTPPPTAREAQQPIEVVDSAAPSDEAAASDISAAAFADAPPQRTALGLGPFPELFNEHAADAAPPLESAPSDEGPAPAPPGPDAAASGAPVVEPELSLEDKFLAQDPEEIPSDHRSGPAKTMRVDFADEQLSAEEALDELGVPGRKRGITIVLALAAAGALAAFAVHKLRPAATNPVQTATATEHAGAVTAPSPGETVPAPAGIEAPAQAQPAEKNEPAPPSAGEKPAGEVAGAAAHKAEPAPVEKPSPANAEKPAAVAPAKLAVSGADKAAPRVAGGSEPARAVEPKSPSVDAAKVVPSADFQRQLATCRRQFLRDQIRDAGTTCAAALEANPHSADALTMMAHVELNRGHLGRANDLAQKSIAIDPNQADAYVIIGGVHQDSGRNAQAKVAYRRYLELAPHGRYASELRSIVGSL